MTQRKLDALRQEEIPDTRTRLVFGMGRLEKFSVVFAAGFSILTFWGTITRPVVDVIHILGLFLVGFAVCYAFSFRLIIDDGFIVKQALGKFHAISFNDIRAWHVRYMLKPLGLYIIESKSGTSFEFPATIERPRELESVLDSLTRHDLEGIE